MIDCYVLLLIPIGLLLAIMCAKALIFYVYSIVFLNNEYDFKKDKGYQKWKERFIGKDDE